MHLSRMKKVIILSLMLLILFINSYGQWYVKKYNVTDINFLSLKQLEESMDQMKGDLLLYSLVTGIGGLAILAGKITLHNGLDDDASIIAEILGSEFMGKAYIVIGAGIVAGGTMAGIICLGRIGSIRSVINNNYAPVGTLNVSPAIIFNSYTRSSCPGFALTYNF